MQKAAEFPAPLPCFIAEFCSFFDVVRQTCAKRKTSIFILCQKVQETRLFDLKRRVLLGTPEGTRTPDLLVRSCP